MTHTAGLTEQSIVFVIFENLENLRDLFWGYNL
jgi:hypothetical protein